MLEKCFILGFYSQVHERDDQPVFLKLKLYLLTIWINYFCSQVRKFELIAVGKLENYISGHKNQLHIHYTIT